MKANALDFANFVKLEIEALKPEDFHGRTRRAKQLREEWYPISRLALHLLQPGLEVEIEVHGAAAGKVDATLRETGFRDRELKVEVTCTYEYEDSLRDELMMETGSAPGAGKITRIAGQISAVVTAVDYDYEIQRNARLVAERIKAKCGKVYSAETLLLVSFEDMAMSGWQNWVNFTEAMRRHEFSAERAPFSAIYVLNACTNEMQRLK